MRTIAAMREAATLFTELNKETKAGLLNMIEDHDEPSRSSLVKSLAGADSAAGRFTRFILGEDPRLPRDARDNKKGRMPFGK